MKHLGSALSGNRGKLFLCVKIALRRYTKKLLHVSLWEEEVAFGVELKM